MISQEWKAKAIGRVAVMVSTLAVAAFGQPDGLGSNTDVQERIEDVVITELCRLNDVLHSSVPRL
jgi:hypothetical protein